MDKLTKEQRHRCMSAIKGKNTKPELLVRKFLFSRGFRYRLNHPRLPGHPDIVLRKYRTVIFVNGCFWHGHEKCKYFRPSKTNIDFWQKKIERNKERDKKAPDNMPNSEVKRRSADGSVGSPHARVGNCQASNLAVSRS